MSDRMPIMREGFSIPFDALNEEWARRNHGQSLARLAERGGLDVCEAIAIIDCRKWAKIADNDRNSAIARLRSLS